MKVYKITATFVGLRPIIQNSAQIADPENEFKKLLDQCFLKKAKDRTQDDRDRIDLIQWKASMQWDDELGIHLPLDGARRMFLDALRNKKKGKQAGAFDIGAGGEFGFPINFKDSKNLKKLEKNKDRHFRRAVVIMRKRVMKTRFITPVNWTINFAGTLYPGFSLEPSHVEDLLNECGLGVGIGDWRPVTSGGNFGKFYVDNFKATAATLSLKA